MKATDPGAAAVVEAAVAVVVRAGVEDHVGLLHAREVVVRCPGRKPPFLAVKHPARLYKAPYKIDLL